MNIISRIALLLAIIGGINWGFIGFFQFDLVAAIFGGQDALLARVIYSLVGISALICIGLLFLPNEDSERVVNRPRRVTPSHVSTEFGEEADFKEKRISEAEKRKQDGNK
ncbi:MAG: DUF378 domain-containing protein [Lysinibacillus sp.]